MTGPPSVEPATSRATGTVSHYVWRRARRGGGGRTRAKHEGFCFQASPKDRTPSDGANPGACVEGLRSKRHQTLGGPVPGRGFREEKTRTGTKRPVIQKIGHALRTKQRNNRWVQGKKAAAGKRGGYLWVITPP